MHYSEVLILIDLYKGEHSMEESKTTETNKEIEQLLKKEQQRNKKKKKKTSTVVKVIIWIVVIIVLIFLTLFFSAWIAPEFNSMWELIRYLFGNS